MRWVGGWVEDMGDKCRFLWLTLITIILEHVIVAIVQIFRLYCCHYGVVMLRHLLDIGNLSHVTFLWYYDVLGLGCAGIISLGRFESKSATSHQLIWSKLPLVALAINHSAF